MYREDRLASLPGGWTLALARVITGWVFIGYGWSSKIHNERFLSGIGETLRRMAEHSAFPVYRSFLSGFAVPHAAAFGLAVGWGESLLGVALLLGAFTNLASTLGIFMLLNFFLATRSSDALLFAVLCLAFLRTSAGSRWGLDPLLARFLPDRIVYFPRS